MKRSSLNLLFAIVMTASLACTGSDSGTDAGPDAGTDAGPDAATDAGLPKPEGTL